jgi:hypothetical protein
VQTWGSFAVNVREKDAERCCSSFLRRSLRYFRWLYRPGPVTCCAAR